MVSGICSSTACPSELDKAGIEKEWTDGFSVKQFAGFFLFYVLFIGKYINGTIPNISTQNATLDFRSLLLSVINLTLNY